MARQQTKKTRSAQASVRKRVATKSGAKSGAQCGAGSEWKLANYTYSMESQEKVGLYNFVERSASKALWPNCRASPSGFRKPQDRSSTVKLQCPRSGTLNMYFMYVCMYVCMSCM